MTISLRRIASLFLGILTPGGSDYRHLPRLDLMALNDRDLADMNLSAHVRSRFRGQREALELRRRV